MARNGSGTYSLPSGNPVVTGTTISSTTQNNTLSDIATALTQSLAKDGQTTPTANLPMGGFKLTGLASGSARTDSASIANIQDGTGIYVATVGGTSDVITLTPSPAISSYSAGQWFAFISSGANTTNVTVNVSGLGAKAITKNGATALVAGDLPASALVSIVYDGTQFQLQTSANLNALSSITGLGTGVATFLATPSSANLAAAVTDETGTGALVFANSPTLVNPALGTPASGVLTNCTNATVSGTAQTTTSGTSFDFTGIPAGVKRVTVSFYNVSLSGSDDILVQLGDSGGIEATGYISACSGTDGSTGGVASSTSGLIIAITDASRAFSGSVVITLVDASTYTFSSTVCGKITSGLVVMGGGEKSLSAELDRIRITRTGSDTFDLGKVNILYER